jgi:hypothetical protein
VRILELVQETGSIRVAANGGGLLFFARLWEQFQDPEAGPTDTFTIITQPAGAPLNGYHDRAPLVLGGAGDLAAGPRIDRMEGMETGIRGLCRQSYVPGHLQTAPSQMAATRGRDVMRHILKGAILVATAESYGRDI